MTKQRYTIPVLILVLTAGITMVWSSFRPATPQESNATTTLTSVLTWHNDIGRTGHNLAETTLTPSNVKHPQFKKLFSDAVDGYVYAQPLYVPGVSISGQSHNVVYVATENDSVYAFDADTAGNPLWHASFIDASAGITPVPASDTDCTGNAPAYGITATPVIDSSNGTLYVVANTKENGNYFYRLHALDIATGAEKFGGPVAIEASVKGTGEGSSGGTISFNALQQHIRPGLLLLNNVVYITSASHCDLEPYHGWLFAYNANSLGQVGVLNTTPDGSAGGIWMSGAGPAADSDGNIYFATGNGTFDVSSGGVDYGESYMKLNSATLAVTDYFTPFNQKALTSADLDLGAGGIVLLPVQSGPDPDELVGAGKDGSIYLVNIDDMGKYNSTGNMIVETIANAVGASGCDTEKYGCVWATPAYWQGNIYIAGHDDTLKDFQLKSGLLGTTPTSESTITFGYFGTTPAISANGATNGIVWVLDSSSWPKGQAVLRAYAANNLSTELYDSNQAGTADYPGLTSKFTVPTIANGKVYVVTQTQLSVYGL
jgi:hypothetical protein